MGPSRGRQRPASPLGPLGPVKRLIDLVIAGVALVLLSPLLLVIAVMVLIDDGWPILYVHERVGLKGRGFPFFKFRTMVKNADKIGAGYEIDANDSRITRSGNFLRHWSLDELPQLVNVLRGEMSVVGPRPTLRYQVETYDDFQRRRLDVRPGLTGLAQVSGRNSLTWPQRIELDVHYIDTYSLWLDLQILFRTVGVLARPEGIYGEGWAKRKEDK